MCSPSRATLLTGRYPGPARRDAHPHRRPTCRPDIRGTRPPCSASSPESLRGPDAPRRRALAQLRSRPAPGSGRSRAASRSFARTRRTSLSCSRARGYEVAYKGKWHLTHPSGGGDDARRLEPRGRRAHRATTTASPTGSRPTPARTPRPSTSAAATRVRSGEGWDEVYTRQVEQLARPAGPPRAVLPRRLAGQPPRRARLSGPVRPAAGTRDDGVPRPRRDAAADAGRGPARQARRSTR